MMRSMVVMIAIAITARSVSVQSNVNSETLDSYFRGRSHPFSGVAMISQNGRILAEKALGLANYELGVLNTPETIFRIGSITKPFTALAILTLVAKHKLSPDDRLCSFLQECPAGWEVISVRNLLNHTSGIPDLLDDVDYSHLEKVRSNIDHRLQTLEHLSLRFFPGTQFEYNNFGYILLGYIIESVTKELYTQYLEESIFKPIQSKNLRYDDPVPIIKNRAEGYILGDEGVHNLRDRSFPFAYSAGGLISSAEDFISLERGLSSGILLPDSLRDQMFTAVLDNYGYGWDVLNEFGRTTYEHAGLVDGFTSKLMIFPQEHVVVITLSNIENENTGAISCDLASMYFEGHPIATGTVKLPPDKLLAFQGTYRRPNAKPLVVEVKNGVLTYRASREYILVPIAEDEFQFSGNEEVHLHFTKDSQGRMEMLRTSCSAREWVASRDQ